MNRQQFSKVVVPGLFSFAKDSFRAKSEEGQWRQLVEAVGSIKTSKRAYEESARWAGLGTLVVKPEQEGIAYDEMLQGPTKRWTHKTYGLGVRISEELIEDSLYPDIGPMETLARELGLAAGETLTVLAFDVINSGTATTSHTGDDGLALFSAAHTQLRGGTWSNLLAPAADLSATSLQTALDAFETTRDDTGKIQVIKAQWILVAPANAWKVKELLNSTYDPESPNNAINALKERNLQAFVSPHLTDTDAFTLGARPAHANGGLIAYQRRKPTVAKDGDFDTGDALIKVTLRWSIEIAKASNLFHSAGA